MVDGHHRHIAVDQLHHLWIIKVHTGDHHAVHTPVVAMFQIAHGLAADVVVDEGDIIAALFRFYLEAVQHCGEVLVGQAALLFVYKQNAKVVSTVGFQRPGRCVGQVPHAACRCTDALSCCVAGAMSGWLFSALLTVATDTPHSFARSFRDGILWPPSKERSCGMFLASSLIVFAISI